MQEIEIEMEEEPISWANVGIIIDAFTLLSVVYYARERDRDV
jgi:hypothetical protein